jgi:hypothetical protein
VRLDAYIKEIQNKVENYNKNHEHRRISDSYGFAVKMKIIIII